MSLGFVPAAVLLTTPKFDEPMLVLGGANCVRLKRLKNSVRNSNPSLSSGPKRVLLNREKSQLFMPDTRREESVRDSLPNTKSGGATKHAVLNHSFSLALPLAGDDLLQPETTFGREPAPNRVVKLAIPLENTRGEAALEDGYTVHAPSTDEFIHDATRAREISPTVAERKVENVADDEPLRDVLR